MGVGDGRLAMGRVSSNRPSLIANHPQAMKSPPLMWIVAPVT